MLRMPYMAFLLLGFGTMISCTGTRPNYLGVREGKLYPCPNTPNCISSFADPSDSEHFRSALPFKKSPKEVLSAIKTRVENYPRTKIILEEPNYINAEFTSFLMRYVDDVEFFLDEKNKLIHFRSASRLGRSDLGVNRKRIESLLKDLDI